MPEAGLRHAGRAESARAHGCALSGNILVDIAGHGAEPRHHIERLERRHIQRELSAPLAAPGARERLALEAPAQSWFDGWRDVPTRTVGRACSAVFELQPLRSPLSVKREGGRLLT